MIHIAYTVTGLPQVSRRLPRRFIPHGDFFPFAVLNKNVRGHVASVGDGWCDIAILLSGFQGQRCVDRVIKRVNNIVCCTGVIVICLEHFQRQGACIHIQALTHVAGVAGGGENGRGVKGFDLEVFGILFVDFLHGLHPGNAAVGHAARSKGISLGSFQEATLFIVASFCRP